MLLSERQIKEFQEVVWDFYRQTRRAMPWRQNPSPYFVLVSEIMLQQTQVTRVLPKFQAFIHAFPTIETLAAASLGDVLSLWSGLGYNRRAKFLHHAAQKVCQDFGGIMPEGMDKLISLPGVGKNTAGAIMAYAFNKPVLFVETNIRTVYFYHFFADQDLITDRAVSDVLAQTLDTEHPREWYWALMDYGTHLKQTAGNNIRLSKHYIKQSSFTGSRRQVRGQVVKLLLAQPLSLAELRADIADGRLETVLEDLIKEGLIRRHNQQFAVNQTS